MSADLGFNTKIANDLMKGVTESLSGRIHILELPGFSQREQCGDPFADCFIHHGGYPELAAHSPFG